jgi:hypothetical protein
MINGYLGLLAASICAVLTGVGIAPAFESGVIATFVEIHASSSDGDAILYLPYMQKTQIIPTNGQKCYLSYHIGNLSGIVGSEAKTLNGVKMIDTIRCR